MSSTLILIENVNKMNFHEFREHFGSVIYGTLACSATVWASKPFSSFQDLHQAFVKFTTLLNQQTKEGLVRCYPDLTGKSIERRKIAKCSQAEQVSAGLNTLSEEETSELEVLNNLYKTKFNFPFVVCVKENTKGSILQSLRIRLKNDRSEEVEKALEEVCKIAYYRLEDIVHKTTLHSKL